MARIELGRGNEGKVEHLCLNEDEMRDKRPHESGVNAAIMLGALRVEVFKPLSSPKFVPCAVKRGNEFVWEFSDEKKTGANKTAFLVCHRDAGNLIIVVSGIKLLKVISLGDLEKCQVVRSTEGLQVVGGKNARELIALKRDVADCLRFTPDFTKTEELLMAFDAKQKLKQVAEIDEKEQQRRAKQAAKDRLCNEILSREKVIGFTADGSKKFGHPVIGSEWECLPGRTEVILFSECKDGEFQGMLEAFRVDKRTSTPKKEFAVAVTPKRPRKEDSRPAVEITNGVFMNGEIVDEFKIVTKAGLAQLKASGVNSGSQFALKCDDQSFQLVELHGKEVRTKGILVALQ